MMISRTFTFVCSLLVSTFAVADNGFERNGFPCVNELCVGDTLESLRGIPWKPFESSYYKTAPKAAAANAEVAYAHFVGPANSLSKLKKQFDRGGRVFDATTFDALLSIGAVCDNDPYVVGTLVIGFYYSKTGRLTEVGFIPYPTVDEKSSVWRVASITRYLPGNYNAGQLAELESKFYSGYSRFKRYGESPLDGKLSPEVDLQKNGKDTSFSLTLARTNLGITDFSGKSRTSNPLCKGRTISID